MSVSILYHRAASKSAPVLAKLIGAAAVKVGKGSYAQPSVLIRYGTAAGPDAALTLNKKEALNAQGNRIKQLMALDKAGIPVPTFWTDLTSAMDNNQDCPVLGRSLLWKGKRSTCGKDIKHYAAGGTVKPGHDYFVEFIPKARQYRVSVVRGKGRVRELVLSTDDMENPPVVWNLRAGFTYDYTGDHAGVRKLGIAAVKALGLDFGAVDIIESTSGKYYVLEVNTAPGLCEHTAGWYAEKFKSIIKEG